MRVVIRDKVTDDLTVYSATALSVQDGYIMLSADKWRGFFPVSRFELAGLGEDGLL